MSFTGSYTEAEPYSFARFFKLQLVKIYYFDKNLTRLLEIFGKRVKKLDMLHFHRMLVVKVFREDCMYDRSFSDQKQIKA